MKTQKFMAGFMLAMMLIATCSTMILAQEEAEPVLISADNSDTSVMDVEPTSNFRNGWDNFRLAFTFNKEKKAELAMKIAEKRFADIEAMAKQGNFKDAEKARERYENFLAKAEEAAEKMQTRKELQSENALIRVEAMQARLQEHKEKLEAVKSRVLEMKAAGNMSEEQLAHLEEVFSRLENRTKVAEARLEQRQETLRTRYKVLSEKSEDEIDAALEQRREEIKAKIQARVQDTDSDDDSEDDSEDSDDEDEDNSSSDAIKLQSGQSA